MNMAKITAINKKFRTVKDKLQYINKECKEPVLFDDLKQLFRAKNFQNVEITHGNREFGKDLVFSYHDPTFDETYWFAVIVKNKNATQNDFVSGGEIAQQIELALKKAFLTSNGEKKIISKVFIVINGSVTDNAKEVLAEVYNAQELSNIKIWNYQQLGNEIDTHIKELFLDNIEPVINVFAGTQIAILSDISRTNQLFDLKLEEIDDIFVNVQTTYSRHLRKVDEYVDFNGGEKAKKKPISIDEFDAAQEILSSEKNFIVHGIATSGKTLLLKRIGLKALKDTSKNSAVFFFELPEVIKGNPKGDLDILSLIDEQFKHLTGGEDFKKDDFQKTILLFDSIDNVKGEDVKLKILDVLDKFTTSEHGKKYQVVIATKTIEVIDLYEVLINFEKTELLPFNVGQALKLVNKIIPDDKAKSMAFTNAIKNSMLDSSILRTPLALTLMAILYKDGSIDLEELPANITEVYNKFVDTYLNRWDGSKGISQQYKYEQTKIILGYIAYEMHKDNTDRINSIDLMEKLREFRKEFSFEELDEIEEFTNHLKYKQGVFNYDEYNDEFYFFNHYFQEYFVSIHIDETKESVLKDNFFEEWWENTIVFYCGKNPNRDIFIKNASKNIVPIELKDSYAFLQLLSKCLQANHSISIKSRIETIDKIIHEFDRFYLNFLKEGKEGKTFAANTTSIDLILTFRSFFDRLLSSKHIANKECFEYFERLLTNEKLQLSDATKYCIAYFYSFNKNDASALELFVKSDGIDIIWQRICYVDLGFLNYKKHNLKSYQRIKRKVNKNKFLIQSRLRGISSNILGEQVKDSK
jgi:hypothetical protein